MRRTLDELMYSAMAAESTPASSASTVLLVEDDDAVRAVTRRALEDAGYTVLEATNGPDAIRLASRHDGEIHAIIIDVVMPGMSGPTCVDWITAARPNVLALYISGYSDYILQAHGVHCRRDLVRKPFTPSELVRAVKDLLG